MLFFGCEQARQYSNNSAMITSSLSTLLLTAGIAAAGSISSNAHWTSTNPQVEVKGNTCTVHPLGGGQDDGPAINYAFELCSNKAHIKLPYAYYVDTVLQSNLSQVEIEFTGMISYAQDVAKWNEQSMYLVYQNASTSFALTGQDVKMYGGGTIEANGALWWSLFAQGAGSGVAGGSSRVFARPVPLAIVNSTRVSIDNIKISNSPFWHSFLYGSSDVSLTNWYLHTVSYNTSTPAANSDGIDVYKSNNVYIAGWTVINDDGEFWPSAAI